MPDSVQNAAFLRALSLIEAFYAQGIQQAYISPGSRSTPLTLALSVHAGFEKTVVLDERSAAFQALGYGKATGTPALLVCTSGTAVANYLPAVIESKLSAIPMIVVSADRPPLHRDVGAPQAINQLHLFGHHAVFFHEAGETSLGSADTKRLHTLAQQAVWYAYNEGGTAHINMPFRKPLEPDSETLSSAIERLRKPDKSLFTLEKTQFSGHATKSIIALIKHKIKPLIIAGPMIHTSDVERHVLAFAAKNRIPILAEGVSNLHRLDADRTAPFIYRFDAFLRNGALRASLQPDLIIRFGQHPVGKGVEALLAELNSSCLHLHVHSNKDWYDASNTTNYRISDAQFEHILTAHSPTSPSWLASWKKADEVQLSYNPSSISELTEGFIYPTTLQKLSPSTDLHVSNSFPVRDLDTFALKHLHLKTFSNRGANGIDGVLSTAIGIARARSTTSVLFIGDLAFQYDATAIASTRDLEALFLCIVLNNNGGRIFEMLPIAQHHSFFEPYFATPQQTVLAHYAHAHQRPYLSARSKEEFEQVLEQALQMKGFVMLECFIDPKASMAARNLVWNTPE